jgi:hypothetical protein
VNHSPYNNTILIAGQSGSGKSGITKSLLERLRDHHYQYCIVDPEGDYEGHEGAVTTGSSSHGPTIDEVLQLLQSPATDVVVNLVGTPLADRPPFFQSLLPRLQEMRGRVGRPHWIIADETHHLLPASWDPGLSALPQQIDRMIFVTVHPDQVMAAALCAVSTLIVVGSEPAKVIEQFCRATHLTPPGEIPSSSETGEVVCWHVRRDSKPFVVKVIPGRAEHRRHVRKYAEGELPADRCFYFRGADGKLNLKAQNLMLFKQIADGVDDATWLHHLHQRDYSRWFREGIHDNVLAEEAEQIERTHLNGAAAQTRKLIKDAIDKYYTLPATPPLPMPGTAAERHGGS